MHMAKIYSENSFENTKHLMPKQETIEFLLSFSKAFTVVKSDCQVHDVFLN